MGIMRDGAVRRLLVITYHFPPDGSIGGQRWAGLSKYLARLGWEVHIITASADTPERGVHGVKRHTVRQRLTLNELYKSAIRRFRRSSQWNRHDITPSSDVVQSTSLFRGIATLRKTLSRAMYFPDYGRGWVFRAGGAACALLREQRFEAVITSGPPHSAHYAGLLATYDRQEPHWVDMRDPWSAAHGRHLPDDWFFRVERHILARLEELLFRRAAKVLVNTPQFAAELRLTEPELNVTCFQNGIDLECIPIREESRVEQCSIAYLGALYAGRNLSVVFKAMRSLLQDRPEMAARLRLRIAGPMDVAHRAELLAQIANDGLSAYVDIHGAIPRAEALDLLNRSHLALVLAQDQPMQVPAKIYECVGMGVATLVIAEETSAAASEARRIGAMTLDVGDVEGVRRILVDLLAGRIPVKIEPKSRISYEELAAQMDHLLQETVTP